MKPQYKQTEVGVIPEDWEVTTIGDVCTFSGGSQPPRFAFKFVPTKGYVRLIQIRDYKSNEFATYIPVSLARKRCDADDIMIGRYGPPVFQILRGIEGAYNVALIKTIPSNKVDREFFYNVLKQESLFQLIDGLSRRTSGQTGVEMPALKSYGLPLPPLPEQRAIATALSDVDALLAALDRLIAKKRDLKQAAMQQLLTGQTRLQGFTGEWEVKRLGEVASISKGTQLHSSETDEGGKFAHLNGGITPSSYTHKSNTEANTIAISEGGNSCGFVQFMTEPYWCGGHCYSVIPNGVDNHFLYHALKGQQSAIMGLRVGSGLPNVQKSGLLDFKIKIPSIHPEQTAIATVLTEMDGELAALEQRWEKTRALKQAMMQELLTGRTRLI